MKFVFTFLVDLLFPILQGPPGPGGGGGQVPITEGIALLVAAALGIGAKFFSKKKK